MIGDPGFLGCVRYIFVTRSHSCTFTFTFTVYIYSVHLTFEDYWLGWPAKNKIEIKRKKNREKKLT